MRPNKDRRTEIILYGLLLIPLLFAAAALAQATEQAQGLAEIVQIGLALKGHDASQRAQGFMTFFGGVVIYFAKDILDMIL